MGDEVLGVVKAGAVGFMAVVEEGAEAGVAGEVSGGFWGAAGAGCVDLGHRVARDL